MSINGVFLKNIKYKKYIFLFSCVVVFSVYIKFFTRETVWTKDMGVERTFYYLVKWKDNEKPVLHEECKMPEYFLVDDSFLKGMPAPMTCNHKKAFVLSADKVRLVGAEIPENRSIDMKANLYVTGVFFHTEAFRTPNMGAEMQIELRTEGHGKETIYIYKINGQRAIPERVDFSW